MIVGVYFDDDSDRLEPLQSEYFVLHDLSLFVFHNFFLLVYFQYVVDIEVIPFLVLLELRVFVVFVCLDGKAEERVEAEVNQLMV